MGLKTNHIEEHPGQLHFDFAVVPNHEYKRPTFEEEYVGIPGEELQVVTPEMRTLFFEHGGWMASDPEVWKWYQKGIVKPDPVRFNPDEWAKQTKNLVTNYKLLTEEKQVGGDHYKNMAITPTKYAVENKLGWLEANVVKYVSRHQSKNGREDVEKALHYCELLLEEYDNAERLTSLTN